MIDFWLMIEEKGVENYAVNVGKNNVNKTKNRPVGRLKVVKAI